MGVEEIVENTEVPTGIEEVDKALGPRIFDLETGQQIPIPVKKSLYSGIVIKAKTKWKGNIRTINYYTQRAYEIPVVIASMPIAIPVILAGITAVKIEDICYVAYGLLKKPEEHPERYNISRIWANPFHIKKVITHKGIENQWKIRSMHPDAHKEYHLAVEKHVVTPGVVNNGNDDRVTYVGRILRKRIDEFPQLFQVLPGTYRLVGNRAQHKEAIEEAEPKYRKALLKGPFGVTGLHQVNKKAKNKRAEAVYYRVYSTKYDREFILPLDMNILGKTLKTIAFGQNC